MENEIWKPVVGYEGYYEVSNMGRVRSSRFNNRIMKLTEHKDGYLTVMFSVKNKRKLFKVHRLVAKAFLPNPDNLPQVNHKDENVKNNNVKNLEFCNNDYNQNYGTRNKRIGEKNTNGKCSKRVYQYTLDGVFVREWKSTMEVQRQLGLHNQHIGNCCNHKYKTCGGFIWRYADEVDKQKGAA